MKRLLLCLAVVIIATVNVLAQEVHGVESRMVCTYDCNPDGSFSFWFKSSRDGYPTYPWFSYEFTNMNSIPVSVEVELYEAHKDSYGRLIDYHIKATKSFVLKSNESYIWKNSDNRGIADSRNRDDYYIKYKAYKLQ